ncbi:MAG: hypothetical protein ABL934_03045 [Lysobacteraceae bacterium]
MSRFLDKTGTKCPHCWTGEHCRYTEVPDSTTHYTQNGVDEVIHNPPTRHYECGNCGTLWVMFEAEGE